jgi:hypothetical protein
MVIVKIWGGLGNQLFQYNFGKYLASQLSTKVLYDIQIINNHRGFTPRDLNITLINIQLEIASKEDINKMKDCTNGFLSRIERKLAQKFPHLFSSFQVESTPHNIIDSHNLKDNCYYDGYWQNYQYLMTMELIFQNEFSLKSPLSENLKESVEKIKSSQSISIHIRRGDYISIKKNYKFYGVCSKIYYENAIQFITRNLFKPTFYIFSDDLSWAKENFIGHQYNFITGNQPAEDLYLMSLCKHNIIANSTFSWWGAWLNQNAEKIVIAPKQWYNGELNKNTVDLIPSSWIRM